MNIPTKAYGAGSIVLLREHHEETPPVGHEPALDRDFGDLNLPGINPRYAGDTGDGVGRGKAF